MLVLRLGGLLLALCAGAATSSRAESGLRVDAPVAFGVIPAATYDSARQRVGNAHLVIEQLAEGRVRMFSDSGYTGGARTVLTAVLGPPADDGSKLMPLRQESRSFDPSGTQLGTLIIDHEKRRGRCLDASGEEAFGLDLPDGDRVANITLNLLLRPLVRRETEELEFQIFLCSGGARLVDMVANVAPYQGNGSGPHAVEIRYGPDFGVASMVARSFLPKLSVWYDPAEPYLWLGHRVPLYGKGPEVFVIREGVPPRWFGDE